jgi:hypothetical protein
MKKQKPRKFSTILRSPALRQFRNKLGFANFNLNTIIVGVEGVKSGIVHKPPDLAVRWEVKNTESAAMQARAFATKALLVFASDAVDHFMRDLGKEPTLFKNPDLASLLRGELVEDRSGSRLSVSTQVIEKFLSDITSARDDFSQFLKKITEFHRSYISIRRRRPRIEDRFDALSESYPGVSEQYRAAIHLLISWRNHHVHGDYSETIDHETINQLRRGADLFREDHSGTDINRALENYLSGAAPTLKELSTLISVTHRSVAMLDLKIREKANIEEYAEAAITAAYRRRGRHAWLADMWRRNPDARERKLKSAIVSHGFTLTETADSKYSLRPEFWEKTISRRG